MPKTPLKPTSRNDGSSCTRQKLEKGQFHKLACVRCRSCSISWSRRSASLRNEGARRCCTLNNPPLLKHYKVFPEARFSSGENANCVACRFTCKFRSCFRVYAAFLEILACTSLKDSGCAVGGTRCLGVCILGLPFGILFALRFGGSGGGGGERGKHSLGFCFWPFFAGGRG